MVSWGPEGKVTSTHSNTDRGGGLGLGLGLGLGGGGGGYDIIKAEAIVPHVPLPPKKIGAPGL